jgi:hypothetical protein
VPGSPPVGRRFVDLMLVKREVGTTLWGPQDPGRAKGLAARD